MFRLTAHYFWKPEAYIDREYDFSAFDLERWSDEAYNWEQDAWNGMKDTVQPVEETVSSGRGDCDDYSLVALSYLSQETNNDVYLAALYGDGGHMVVYDHSDKKVYSSGRIHYETLSEYFGESDYSICLTRNV